MGTTATTRLRRTTATKTTKTTTTAAAITTTKRVNVPKTCVSVGDPHLTTTRCAIRLSCCRLENALREGQPEDRTGTSEVQNERRRRSSQPCGAVLHERWHLVGRDARRRCSVEFWRDKNVLEPQREADGDNGRLFEVLVGASRTHLQRVCHDERLRGCHRSMHSRQITATLGQGQPSRLPPPDPT